MHVIARNMTCRSVAVQVQRAIESRTPLKAVVALIGGTVRDQGLDKAAPAADIREFVFVAARVHKMCDKFKRDRTSIQSAAKQADAAVGDRWGSNPKAVAQYAWSLATMGIQPSAWPPNMDTLFDSRTANKELCNTLWALSKWDSPQSESLFSTLSAKLIDTERASQFTDDELVALLRAMASVHEHHT